MEFCCDDEGINNAIRDCYCRTEFDGVDICRVACSPCLNEIDKGRCLTLKEYFKKHNAKESEADNKPTTIEVYKEITKNEARSISFDGGDEDDE